MDPMILGAMLGMVAMGTSFAAGKVLYGAAWRMFNPELARRMSERQEDFMRRLTLARVDNFVPSTGADAMPQDDFWGAKISSPMDYRRWLKMQKTYREQAIGEGEV